MDFADGLRKAIGYACILLITTLYAVQALAQQTGPTDKSKPVVGLLVVGGPVPCDSGAAGYSAACMVEGLHALGYIEGRNVAFVYRYARGDYGKMPVLAGELAALHPNVVFASTDPGAQAAAQATRTIPIVVGSASEDLMTRLVGNLAHPSGNVTGLTLAGYPQQQKVLQLLRETLPQMARVAVIQNPRSADGTRTSDALRQAARELRVTLIWFEAGSGADLPRVLAEVAASGVDALFIPDEPLLMGVSEARKLVGEWALSHHMPAASSHPEFAASGGLLSFGADVRQVARRAGYYVHRLLSGAQPSDLPVETPAIFRMTVNLRTARTLHITIPNGVLVRADRVIE